MAAYAILKTIKSDLSWAKCVKKANEAIFRTKFGIPDPMEGFLRHSETTLTFESKMAAPNMASDAIFKILKQWFLSSQMCYLDLWIVIFY